VEPDDRDTEIFERIPWEALEKNAGERRWWVYLAAAALFMGGLGVTIGRSTVSPAEPLRPDPPQSPMIIESPEPTTSSVPSPSTTTIAAEETTEGTWAEADLMAAPVPALETAAASLAEWFIVDFFTRDGTGDEEGRSFVDWAGPIGLKWLDDARAEVTVLIRRLAAPGEGPYERLADEAWRIVLTLADAGWKVTDGPFPAQPPDAVVALEELGSDVPDRVQELASDQTVRAASPMGSDWLVEVDWTDVAGLHWPIRRLLPAGP
jgi:hypothetical protein